VFVGVLGCLVIKSGPFEIQTRKNWAKVSLSLRGTKM
jgi:hypothetical protein